MPRKLLQTDDGRTIGILGSLGLYPIARLSIPVRRLFVLLALSGAAMERGFAAALLWPDQTDQAARSNLRRTLFQSPRGWILSEGDEILLDARVDLDAARLVAAKALAGEALTFEEIELLCQDILPGWHEEWLQSPQESFRMLRLQALEEACRTMTAGGQLGLAAHAGSAALIAEPLSESAAEALILCHLAQHNRFQAKRCYDALERRLSDELGVAPDPLLRSHLLEAGGKSLLIH